MSFRRSLLTFASLASLGLLAGELVAQQASGKAASAKKSEALIEQASQAGKYAFLLFYKQNDAATTAMHTTLKTSLAEYGDDVLLVPVQVGNPADQALVAKYDVARAPMPMMLALAPNKAVT